MNCILKSKYFIVIILLLLLTLVLWSVNHGKVRTESSQEARVLTLYCDVALRPVLEEIIGTFQRRSDIRILSEYAASNTLLDTFIEDPDIADLFLAVDISFLDQARNAGRVDDIHVIAQTKPVLMLRSGMPHIVLSIKDLTQSGVRVGMPDLMSALGRVTVGVLKNYDMELEDIQHNIVVQDATAPELANAIRTGRIDVALVWESLARMTDRSEWLSIPEDKSNVVGVGIARSVRTPDVHAAEEFIAFLRMRAAQEVLIKHHYELPAQP